MSFHHNQPCKGNLSENFEPLADSSQPEDEGLGAFTADEDEARFELLSAYVDDEVSGEERRLVDQWLRDEPAMQQMYQQLLILRQAIRTAPVPTPPPLEVPTPPSLWKRALSSGLHWPLICTVAIAALGTLSQWGIPYGRQNLEETWQFLKTVPQETLLVNAIQAMSTQALTL